MHLSSDLWEFTKAVFSNWIWLASDIVGFAIVIWEKRKKKEISLPIYTAILLACLLPSEYWAWHELEGSLRASHQESEDLRKQLTEVQKGPALPTVAIDTGSKETSGSSSPVVTGSGNSFTYGAPPPDKPAQTPARKKQ
jgi:hypothetical protein